MSLQFILFITAAAVFLNCADRSLTARPGDPLFAVVHYANPLTKISYGDLKLILNGRVKNFSLVGGEDRSIAIYVDGRVSRLVKKIFPECGAIPASFTEDGDIASNEGLLGICGIDGLRPELRALYIDGSLPWGRLGDDYTLSRADDYPLTAPGAGAFSVADIATVVQTGVTAMTRAFISAVERGGDLMRPVRQTREITSQADLAMTSNEVSFLEPCTVPLPDRMSFCTPKRYFAILESSGFDVIEVTGNHNNDYGRRHNADTLGMILQSGMVYFGGGKNRADAAMVRYRSVRDTRFAFVGFNELGPPNAWATGNRPGALRLEPDLFKSLVGEAIRNADIVFVSVQWGNEDNPVPQSNQVEYFHRAADMGAAIMVSSSSHRAMGIEFYEGRFISYGLGNFLFDQMQTINHRQGLMARHLFYRKRHLQTELIPYLIHNHSEPRIARGREARELFRYVFRYSRGPVFGR